MSKWYDNGPDEEEIEEVAGKAAKRILEVMIQDKKIEDSIPKKIYSEVDLEKADGLRGEEKIIGFFKALVQNDRIALKSLSEGVAADKNFCPLYA